jgi:nickel-dependent lactate racemase
LLEIHKGGESWSVAGAAAASMTVLRPPPASGQSPRELVRAALEAPYRFEPLRRALTPDDHIAIALDADLPHAAELLTGVLEHLESAGIAMEAVTVITPSGSRQAWIDELPEGFDAITAETHDPADRKKLAYLASTKDGRRVYLNRTLVQADFTIVLSGRRFDPAYGYAGGELALYPNLSDEEARAANAGPFTKQEPWDGREESREVAWLLGTPFLVQIIEGEDDDIFEVVAGLMESSDEGRRRQDVAWKWSIPEKADAVVAAVTGDPDRLTFLDFAKAAACAARAVKKGGRIALVTTAAPPLGEAAEWIRALDEPKAPLARLMKEKPADWAACKLWCSAAAHASLFLASNYPDDLVEEMFATPLHSSAELQRLIGSAGAVVVLHDAHKAKVQAPS